MITDNAVSVYVGDGFESLVGQSVEPEDSNPVFIEPNNSVIWECLRQVNEQCGTSISIIGYEDIRNEDLDVMAKTIKSCLLSLKQDPREEIEQTVEYQKEDPQGSFVFDHLETVRYSKLETIHTGELLVRKAEEAKRKGKALSFLGH